MHIKNLTFMLGGSKHIHFVVEKGFEIGTKFQSHYKIHLHRRAFIASFTSTKLNPP
jgi:hypothetical protein